MDWLTDELTNNPSCIAFSRNKTIFLGINTCGHMLWEIQDGLCCMIFSTIITQGLSKQ